MKNNDLMRKKEFNDVEDWTSGSQTFSITSPLITSV